MGLGLGLGFGLGLGVRGGLRVGVALVDPVLISLGDGRRHPRVEAPALVGDVVDEAEGAATVLVAHARRRLG